MQATILKVVGSILATALAQFGPALISQALGKIQGKLAGSPKFSIYVEEFEAILLKATGYSSLSGMLIGFLSYCQAHDASYIKNGLLASAMTFGLGVAIAGLKKANSGSVAVSPDELVGLNLLAMACQTKPGACTDPDCSATSCKLSSSLEPYAAPK